MRFFILFALFACIQVSQAQSSSNEPRAEDAFKMGELQTAKEQIDLAVQFKKSAKRPDVWFLQGRIYMALVLDDISALTSTQLLGYYQKSHESFEKAKELNKKKRVTPSEIVLNQKSLKDLALRQGIKQFNIGDYMQCANFSKVAEDVAASYNVIDSISIFNQASSYRLLKKYNEAILHYERCVALGYREADIYVDLYYSYYYNEDFENAMATLKKGREKFPEHEDLLTVQLNKYLLDGENTEALILLDEVIKKYPDRSSLYYVRGGLRESLGMGELPIVSDYKKAIELNPTFFDALFSLGTYYYKLSNEHMKSALEYSDDASTQKEKEKVIGRLQAALPYIEAAYKINRTDAQLLSTLKQLYLSLEMFDEYKSLLKN